MTSTIEKLWVYMQSSGVCKFQHETVVEREMVDNLMKGLQVIQTKKTSHHVEDGKEDGVGDLEEEPEACEIGATDLEAH
jgi:hypothetical protein